jgi:chaperonin GroEL (HSP60 family)
MNKMVINHLEKLFVTSDASTIVTEMDVYHPAAKLLVMAAKAQAGEVGDATNLVSRVQYVGLAPCVFCCRCCSCMFCPCLASS